MGLLSTFKAVSTSFNGTKCSSSSYPTTYVSVVGKISVSNSCGVIGSTYTNPTPVAVPAITTASYASWPSGCRPQGNYVDAVIDTLDAADIACPTWGLSDPFYTTCDGDVYLTATEGYPYNPVILVPTQFLNYDPSWGSCTKIPINGPFILPCGVYDPPRALHAASALAPKVTSNSDPATSPPVAEPEVTAQPNVAKSTAQPAQAPQTIKAKLPPAVKPFGAAPQDPPAESSPTADPSESPAGNSPAADPGQAPAGNSPVADPSNSNNDPQTGSNEDPAENSGGAPAADPNQAPASNDPAQNSNGQSAGSQAAPAADPQKAAPALQPVAQITINIGGSQPSPLGGIIHSAFGNTVAAGGQQSPQQTAQGGDSQGSSSSGQSSSSSSGGSGGSSSSDSGGSTSGGSGGGTTGGSEDGSSGGSQADGSGGSSESSDGGSQGAMENGSGGGSSGSSSTGSTGNTEAGSGSSSGGSSGENGGDSQANPAAFTPHAITALGQTLSAINPSAIAIADKTLSVGGPAFTSDGNFYSLGSSGNLIAGTLASGATPTPALTFAGSTFTANSASQFVIAGQTLAPGGQITVSGTPISLAPGSSNVAVIGSSTQPLSMITPAPAVGQASAVLTFDGSTYSANAASQFVIAGQTLNPGAQITVSGTPISLGPTASSANFAVIGTSTQALQNAAASQSPALLTFDGSTYTANSASQFIIAGKTLTPGGSITVFGMPISEDSSGAFAAIGSSTQSLVYPAATQQPALMTFGGQTYTANAASQFVIGGQTLTPGGKITVSGTPISEAASGSGLVAIGSSTQVLGHAPASITGAALMTFNGQTYTANAASDFVIDGQTLTPGGQITISGTPISEGALGSNLVAIGTSTQVLGHASPGVTGAAVMTFAGQTFTANSASDFVIDGQTLTPGGIITVSGTPISEAADATDVVIGSSTQLLGHASPGVTEAAIMTFAGQTFTANSASDFIIDGQTLTPGGMITVSGTPISEAADATDVVIGSSTEILGTAAITSSAMAFEGAGTKIDATDVISKWLFGWFGMAFFSGLSYLVFLV